MGVETIIPNDHLGPGQERSAGGIELSPDRLDECVVNGFVGQVPIPTGVVHRQGKQAASKIGKILNKHDDSSDFDASDKDLVLVAVHPAESEHGKTSAVRCIIRNDGRLISSFLPISCRIFFPFFVNIRLAI